LGLEIVSMGVRDVILPGDMKDLMNKVTETKKATEAQPDCSARGAAAMRSQANTARLLADHLTLMRLRELEVLDKVATAGKRNVVLGEGAWPTESSTSCEFAASDSRNGTGGSTSVFSLLATSAWSRHTIRFILVAVSRDASTTALIEPTPDLPF
jgi:hypothetical protein